MRPTARCPRLALSLLVAALASSSCLTDCAAPSGTFERRAAALAEDYIRITRTTNATPIAREAIGTFRAAKELYDAGKYARSREALDALWARYPYGDPAWGDEPWPTAYVQLHMLTQCARARTSPDWFTGKPEPLNVTVVLIGKTVSTNRTCLLDQGLVSNDFRRIRLSLDFFGEYIRAITRGRLQLKETIVHLPDLELPYADEPGPRGQRMFGFLDVADQVPEAIRKTTDWYWMIRPIHPDLNIFEGVCSVGPPYFLCDDAWVMGTKTRPGQPFDDIEYDFFATWLHHEFFHYLFHGYPEFGLEELDHEWWYRDRWPSNFVGRFEADYHTEALNKLILAQGKRPPNEVFTEFRGRLMRPDLEAQVESAASQPAPPPAGFPSRAVELATNLFQRVHHTNALPITTEVVGFYLAAKEIYDAGRYEECGKILEAFWTHYPMGAAAWDPVAMTKECHVLGHPHGYVALQMLAECCRARTAPDWFKGPPEPVRLTVVLIGKTVATNGTTTLDARLMEKDNRRIHRSLALFKEYVLAMTKGRLDLQARVIHVPNYEVPYSPADPNGMHHYHYWQVEADVPQEIRDNTDWWWMIRPLRPGLTISEGMGMGGGSPHWLCDDGWVSGEKTHPGKLREDEEYDLYFAQWLQHEFYHYVFALYPEFELEKEGHQWFDRSKCAADFAASGRFESDYYSEALEKRIQPKGAVPLHVKLKPKGKWDAPSGAAR